MSGGILAQCKVLKVSNRQRIKVGENRNFAMFMERQVTIFHFLVTGVIKFQVI